MPTYFEIVGETLDRSYSDIESPKKDKLIIARLAKLSAQYANLLVEGGPSYADDITRFAYVFRYTTAHADYLHQLLSYSPDLRAALGGDTVTISCVGGGPGSDVLGLLKYFLTNKRPQKIIFFILDKEPAWGETWADLDATVSQELKTSRTYLPIDVTNPSSYESFVKPFRANVFTLIYFLSEIYKYRTRADAFLSTCFSRMNKGAVIVVLDFHDSNLEKWIDDCAGKHGLLELVSADDSNFTVTPAEEKSALKKYIDKFGAQN
jgi:hypothetical protein